MLWQMATVTIEIDEALLRKAQEYAASCGYHSFSAFCEGIIMERLAQASDASDTRKATEKFEELGYLDAGLDI